MHTANAAFLLCYILYYILVLASNVSSIHVLQPLLITVQDANEPPTYLEMIGGSDKFDAQAEVGHLIASLSGHDPDMNQSLTYITVGPNSNIIQVSTNSCSE